MTWEEAEAQFPGCSAQWDVVATTALGDWRIESLYTNALDYLTLRVHSTAYEFVSGSGLLRTWALFQFTPQFTSRWPSWCVI